MNVNILFHLRISGVAEEAHRQAALRCPVFARPIAQRRDEARETFLPRLTST